VFFGGKVMLGATGAGVTCEDVAPLGDPPEQATALKAVNIASHRARRPKFASIPACLCLRLSTLKPTSFAPQTFKWPVRRKC
jgi:hypothetical protein